MRLEFLTKSNTRKPEEPNADVANPQVMLNYIRGLERAKARRRKPPSTKKRQKLPTQPRGGE
ncbi:MULTISPECIES: hypothetical protein [Microcystis]|uniref:Transposase n=1 Tax=Microcystis wesenbergii NRERC-220 TaxID=3068991 RepID=A0ABU3HKR7_9CHRO|nr:MULTISPECIES: hypothetical protein [Microcystis]MBD2116853.1 hypothetical protein [Microcystis wesenbergii FACHB-1339]MCZ8039591.1 hypothetical protein [Microcystis sp. LE17-20A]MDT3675107.1 hypothetical protein [Microcystis wesenbergii NRERC-220]